jgi:hypothetical protein
VQGWPVGASKAAPPTEERAVLKRILAVAAVLSLLLPAHAARADSVLTVGSVFFAEHGNYCPGIGFGAPDTCYVLGNDKVSRGWTTYNDGMVYDGFLRDSSAFWLLLDLPEFSVTLGIPQDQGFLTFDARRFVITKVTPVALRDGIRLTFRYEFGAHLEATDPPDNLSQLVGLAVNRSITLHEGSSVFEITNVLENSTPLPLRVHSFRLDEIFAPTIGPNVEISSYVGGSDWRDDFRTISSASTDPGCHPLAVVAVQCDSSVDREGEVVRTEDGKGRGWFQVAERRGGAASRAGLEYWDEGGALETTWVGADFTRDALDAGPILTSPPSYNRVENPAYPAPVRGRLVPPFSTFKLGTVGTGVYHGGAQAAGVAYANYVTEHRAPQFARRVTLNSFHPWSHGADFNDATMRKQADAAAALGVDEIILDDQWQGGTGGESGDWNWDPARFPDSNGDGRADIVDYFRSKGIDLGLWMSPVEFNANSQTFLAHPDWACTPIGDATWQYPDDAGFGVWDITNPKLQNYLTSVIDRLIEKNGVTEFKFDFMAWTDCPPHDYNDYEDAFAAWVDRLEAKHPTVTFETDETNDQRMWAFESAARGPTWFDNTHGHKTVTGATVGRAAQLLHDVWMAAPWITPSTIGAGTFDGTLDDGYDASYLLPIACLTHWTFWTDLTKLSPQVQAETKWWIDWYHAHASALRGGAYELSAADPYDGAAPVAFQISNYLFAFRQSGDAPAVTLQSLDPSKTYTLTNVRDGSVLAYTPGMTIPLGAQNSAGVYQIDAV